MLQDKEEKETKWTRVVAIMARVPEYWAILHSRIRPGRWMVTFPGVYKREGTFLEEKSQGISEEAKRGETGGSVHHRKPIVLNTGSLVDSRRLSEAKNGHQT